MDKPYAEDQPQKSKKTISKKTEILIEEIKKNIPKVNELFDIHRKIGNGTFSEVVLASLKSESQKKNAEKKFFAIKYLLPVSHPNRIQKELKCLLTIGGTNNVVGIDLCLRNDEYVCFVMPHMVHYRFVDFFDKMCADETKEYIKNLLIALRHVHSFNIIHRDVKPSNFLYDRKMRRYSLVDFGLAQELNKEENCDNANKKRKLSETTNDSQIAKKYRMDHGIENENKKNEMVLEKNPNPKSPLKQSNHNTGREMRSFTRDLKKFSPLERDVKSRVLGISVNMKLNKNLNTPGPSTSIDKKKIETCFCYGKSTVCNICIVKQEIQASRAGTPGYRPPEVLFKYPNQTPAVDIWAVGVIFISIISKCYPFFRGVDDLNSLSEIITIFGDHNIKKVGFSLDRHLKISRKLKPVNIKKLCFFLRQNLGAKKNVDEDNLNTNYSCKNCNQFSNECLCFDDSEIIVDDYTNNAFDLLKKLLDVDPKTRISAEEALNHPYFEEL